MIITDGADLLTPPDLLSLTHDNLVEMAVEGIGEVKLTILDPGMADDNHIAPVRVDVPSQNNHAIPDRVDGTSEALGTPPVGDPILTQMPSCTEAP